MIYGDNASPYTANKQTGMYEPSAHPSARGISPAGQGKELNDMVQAMMRGYLRKQETPGSYLPLTSAAPTDAMDAFKPLDKYHSFGVPYTGFSYGEQSGGGDPYNAMFSQAPSNY